MSRDYIIQCKTLPQGRYLSIPTQTPTVSWASPTRSTLPPSLGQDWYPHHWEDWRKRTDGMLSGSMEGWYFLLNLALRPTISLPLTLRFSSSFYFSLSASHLPMRSEGLNYILTFFMNNLKFVCGLQEGILLLKLLLRELCHKKCVYRILCFIFRLVTKWQAHGLKRVFQNRKVKRKGFNKCDKMIIVCPDLFTSRITDEDMRTGDAFTNGGHKNGYKNGDKQGNDSRLLCETKAAQRHSAYSLQPASMSYLSKRVI